MRDEARRTEVMAEVMFAWNRQRGGAVVIG